MKETERINGWNGAPNGFVEVLPANYVASKKYPTLFWLHGQGELGQGTDSSLDKLQRTVVTWLRANEVNFIVLVVQYPWNGWKVTGFVRWALKNYATSIDVNSLHLAGLSMGGYVIRDFIIENSDVYKMFSTLTPMSTNLDGAVPYANRIVDNNQYVWAHAGEVDGGANQPGALARFIKAVQAIDKTRADLTIYKAMGHAAWEEVYDNSGREREEIAATTWEGATLTKWLPGMYSWWEYLLAHDKRNVDEPNPNPEPEPPVEIVDGFSMGYIFKGEAYIVTDGGIKYKFQVTKV